MSRLMEVSQKVDDLLVVNSVLSSEGLFFSI